MIFLNRQCRAQLETLVQYRCHYIIIISILNCIDSITDQCSFRTQHLAGGLSF